MTCFGEYFQKVLSNTENLIHRAEKIERTCPDQTNKDEAKALKEDLIENKQEMETEFGKIVREKSQHDLEEIKRLEEIVNKATTDNEYVQKRIVELEAEIFRLDEKIEVIQDELRNVKKEMNTATDTLKLGQLAFDFEKDLATYIYPQEKKIGSNQIFARMKEWLEKKKETDQGKEANTKWESLKQNVAWSIMHEDVLRKLKKSRIIYAHPNVELDTVRTIIPEDTYTAEEKKCIDDIIDIAEKVNDAIAADV